MPFRILAIDGGGIRGLLPATVLTELERITGRRVHELFDLVVGTSTGAVLALGLMTPGPGGSPRYTAEELRGLYLDEGPNIFSRSLFYRARSLEGVASAKYPASSIDEVLQRYFGEARLADALGDVLVTSYETERRQPFLLRSRRAREREDSDFAVRDVARAATAAPTFFPPARVTGADGSSWSLIDGGVYANNPAMVGVVEAMAAYDASDVLSLSLGTGILTRPLPYRQIRSWGLVRWARPLVNIVFDAGTSTVDFQAAALSRTTSDVAEHLRLDAPLTEVSDDIDDASQDNLRALVDLADRLVSERAGDLERVAETLVEGAADQG